jgi:DNA invertase Pin-like site-specific DNA recombinase
MKYGYARVSTDGQSVAAQVAQLTQAGADKVFKEVASGARSTRAQPRRLLNVLDEDDVLLVTRLDRLARSTRDLLNTLAQIAEKKAAFRSLGDTWADTTTAHGRLMPTVLAGLAEFERELIRARTTEGRERAKARGVKLGRKFKLTAHQQREARGGGRAVKRSWTSPAATTSATAPYRGSGHDRHHSLSHKSCEANAPLLPARRAAGFVRAMVPDARVGPHWKHGPGALDPLLHPQQAQDALDKQRRLKERRGYDKQ